MIKPNLGQWGEARPLRPPLNPSLHIPCGITAVS